MHEGTPFEEAYKRTLQAVSPEGLQEIEEELFFVLHFNKQITMKKILYGSGFVAAFSFSCLTLCRHLHWFDNGVMFLFIGCAALLVGVLPVLAAMTYQNAKLLSASEKTRMVVGILSGLFISVGLTFKALHYPTANLNFVIGMVLFAFIFLPMFFVQLYKRAIA